MVGHCLHVWPIFSDVMPCFRVGYPVLYLRLFKAPLLFHLWVFALLLSGLYSFFFYA
jgi:hypothetical protein